MENDTSYPERYACDYICSLAGYDEHGIVLIREDASAILTGIAQALGMDDVELACKLADYHNQHESTSDEQPITLNYFGDSNCG